MTPKDIAHYAGMIGGLIVGSGGTRLLGYGGLVQIVAGLLVGVALSHVAQRIVGRLLKKPRKEPE